MTAVHPGRVAGIDGLRAIAMTMVIAQHCKILPCGWIGVWIFFVISGYVITLTLTSEHGDARRIDDDGWAGYSAFIVRRFFRIVPVYIFYIGANCVIIQLLRIPYNFEQIPALLTFSFNWQMIYQIYAANGEWAPFGHLWTLSVEEQFYIVFPFLLLFLARRRALAVMLALILAAPLLRWGTATLAGASGYDPGRIAFSVYASSLCQIDAFLAGAVLALARQTVCDDARIAPRLWIVTAVAFTTYVLVYVGLNFRLGATDSDAFRNVISGILSGQGREIFVYSVVTLLASSVLVAILTRHPLVQGLNWVPLVRVGTVSYGGYLYHALVLHLIFRLVVPASDAPLPVWVRIALFVMVWCLSVGTALASFRIIERPFLRLGRVLVGVNRRGSNLEVTHR